MNISELESTKFDHFNSVADLRIRNSQVNAVKYIKKLASVSNTDISHWNLTELFKSDAGFVTERDKINKVFFTYKELAPRNPTIIPEDSYAKLLKLQENRARTSADNIKQQALRKRDEALRVYETYFKYLADSNVLFRRYHSLSGYVPNFSKEIQDVAEAGFFKLLRVTERGVEFATVNEVYLTHIDTRYAVKRTVNFGKFLISFDIMNSAVRVFVLENNLNNGSSAHPHILSDKLCFGEMNDEAVAVLSMGNIVGTMEMVQRALTAYNPDSCYRTLEEFEEDRRIMEQKKIDQEAMDGQEEFKEEDEGDGEEDVEF